MFNKIICAIFWMLFIMTIVANVRLAKENDLLRSELYAPVDCSAVCETAFEEMGC